MIDLVTRLRMAAVEIDRINGPLLGPAADEIERLTNAWTDLVKASGDMEMSYDSEIERLKAENEVLRELSEVHSYDC